MVALGEMPLPVRDRVKALPAIDLALTAEGLLSTFAALRTTRVEVFSRLVIMFLIDSMVIR